MALLFLEDAVFKYLLPTAEEELVGINSICDSTANERHPVKHQWRLIGTFDEELAKHVENDGNNNER